MIISVKYYNKDKTVSHECKSEWNKTELHCLNCGAKNIWSEELGDYYEGETHICLECNHYFNLPQEPQDGMKCEQNSQVLEIIKNKQNKC